MDDVVDGSQGVHEVIRSKCSFARSTLPPRTRLAHAERALSLSFRSRQPQGRPIHNSILTESSPIFDRADSIRSPSSMSERNILERQFVAIRTCEDITIRVLDHIEMPAGEPSSRSRKSRGSTMSELKTIDLATVEAAPEQSRDQVDCSLSQSSPVDPALFWSRGHDFNING